MRIKPQLSKYLMQNVQYTFHFSLRHAVVCETQVIASGAARRYAPPPPADGSSTRCGSTSICRRVCNPHTAKLQAASMPIAQGSCTPGTAVP